MPRPLAPPAAGEIHLHWLRHDAARGRAPLRALLAGCLGVAADALDIVQTAAHLKPRLAPPHDALRFNWSHSGALALVALALDVDPGVDVERIERRNDVMAIARRFFAEAEIAALANADAAQQREHFTRAWAVKEAVVKAHGGGLAQALTQVEVVLDAASPRLRRVPAGMVAEWQCVAPSPPLPGYRAALAWRGDPHQLVVHGETLSSSVPPETAP